MRIPGDLSVVGFDDVPIAAYARPPLSTFDQDIERSAAIIADMVVDAIEKGLEVVEPRLVEARVRRPGQPRPGPETTETRRPPVTGPA